MFLRVPVLFVRINFVPLLRFDELFVGNFGLLELTAPINLLFVELSPHQLLLFMFLLLFLLLTLFLFELPCSLFLLICVAFTFFDFNFSDFVLLLHFVVDCRLLVVIHLVLDLGQIFREEYDFRQFIQLGEHAGLFKLLHVCLCDPLPLSLLLAHENADVVGFNHVQPVCKRYCLPSKRLSLLLFFLRVHFQHSFFKL